MWFIYSLFFIVWIMDLQPFYVNFFHIKNAFEKNAK